MIWLLYLIFGTIVAIIAVWVLLCIAAGWAEEDYDEYKDL